MIAAAKHIAAIVVRDPAGGIIYWESLAINNLQSLVQLAHSQKPGNDAMMATVPGSGTYVVSLTLSARADQDLAEAQHFGAQRREPAPH